MERRSDFGISGENNAKSEDRAEEHEEGAKNLLSSKRKSAKESARENMRYESAASSKIVRSCDIGWKYAYLKNHKDKSRVTCIFCHKEIVQGIYRLKIHLAQYGGLVTKCKKCPIEVRDEVRSFLAKNSRNKGRGKCSRIIRSSESVCDNFCLGDAVELVNLTSGRPPRALKRKGPANLETVLEKLKLEQVHEDIGQFLIEAEIPLDAVKSKSFKEMIEKIGQLGSYFEPPTCDEMIALLKKEVKCTMKLIVSAKELWAKTGCSIMVDSLTDETNGTLINFLVNSPAGTVFIKSVDATHMETPQKVFKLLDSVVETVGEKNVVQVVTPNTSTYVAARKLLMEKRNHLYWTPCATHCIGTMLEDIGGLPKVKELIEKAISLSGFLHSYGFVLNLMRNFTRKKDIIRFSITRFTTSFLTLQNIYKHKDALEKVFSSNEWRSCESHYGLKGREAKDIVFSNSFWNGVVYAIKISAPLIRVLRLVNGEKTPPMGYIYEAINRTKEDIKKATEEDEQKYKPIWEIIDKRWIEQLHHPLYAAGHFLNPACFYNKNLNQEAKVVQGMMDVVERLADSPNLVDAIKKELTMYISSDGLFGQGAVRSRTTMLPSTWWRLFGVGAPNLKDLATKVLSLTCSGYGCWRNLSKFKHVYSKEMKARDREELKDVVFVGYNRELVNRFNKRDSLDPIKSKDVDDCNEWLTGILQEVNEDELEDEARDTFDNEEFYNEVLDEDSEEDVEDIDDEALEYFVDND